MLMWIKKKLIELGWRLEWQEESHIIEVNDRRTVFIDCRYNGDVKISISEKPLGEVRSGLCGVQITKDNTVSYMGKHYAQVGLLDWDNNKIIPWDIEKGLSVASDKGGSR